MTLFSTWYSYSWDQPVDGDDGKQKAAEKDAQSDAERYRHKHACNARNDY